ncbi:MAG TPA: 3-oxoacyl-[acyl-carrier-protein] synthase III C-terminal domain-containing protein [Candidatus Sulfotelmatobacter sp.]|nr:3-oxoacyl-[acyl-carrier-protein] synthase III C-terminal domain-containing protein [Candidatus Sulfotelmatobacter sp.]
MFIAGVGTAAPPYRYAQRDCWEALQQARQFQGLTPRSRALLRKVLTASNGIATRHLALERLEEAFALTPDALHARFRQQAPLLATQAAERALAEAALGVDQVDALIISTCTGYLCPGLSSYVAERLGLRPEVLGLDLVGQGCAAALPNLRAGEALLASGRCRYVLSVCVEVCSAAFYLDDDPGVLISACLFGDGAGAAVLAPAPQGQRRLEWKQCASLLQPKDRDLLRFEQTQGMLRNILSPLVPLLAAKYASHVFQQVLAQAGLQPADINGWVLHPGGRDVLAALSHGLGLSEQDLRWSAAVLREFGNLSSSSLFFVLQQALTEGAPGGYWWLSSFGAGFSCHGALLEVD